jgi:hypothetical protein
MYSWYKASQVCYAYLADVHRGDTLSDDLRRIQWFTRGWTLQELLAPRSVVFFDNNWIDIGSKQSLEEIISEITGIDDFVNFGTACVAQKMSWAAKRYTTRIEDEAYCLLGLFDVNMPPLYGEGKKAFMRLQLEILKISDDESIFVWYDESRDNESRYGQPGQLPLSGLLADSPECFWYSGGIRPIHPKDRFKSFTLWKDNPFSMTNKGLHISLNLFPYSLKDGIFIVPLECSSLGEDGEEQDACPAIFLQRKVVHSVERYGRAFVPIDKKLLLLTHDEIRRMMLKKNGNVNRYIYINPEYEGPERSNPRHRDIIVNTSSLQQHGFVVSGHEADGEGRCTWDKSKHNEIVLALRLRKEMVVRVLFTNDQTRESIVLAIVVGIEAEPCVLVLTTGNGPSQRDKNVALSQPWFVATSHAASETSEISAPRAKVLEEEVPVASPASEKPIGKLFGRIIEAKRPLDRISRHFRDGKSISASLRRVRARFSIWGPCPRFRIDVKIDSGDSLQWPAPSWVEELLDSVAGNNED